VLSIGRDNLKFFGYFDPIFNFGEKIGHLKVKAFFRNHPFRTKIKQHGLLFGHKKHFFHYQVSKLLRGYIFKDRHQYLAGLPTEIFIKKFSGSFARSRSCPTFLGDRRNERRRLSKREGCYIPSFL